MKAILLSVGDELVLGQTLDTNSAWMAQQLAAVGCAVVRHVTVGDDRADIEDALRAATASGDAVVVSGGLGPTDDDLTRFAAAAVAGVELVLDPDCLALIEDFFRQRKRPMVERNQVQAMLPAGCAVLPNPHGTACGFALTLPGPARPTTAYFLPGVPKEMKPMFADHVLPRVRAAAGGGGGGDATVLQRTLHTFGAGESQVAEMLGDLMTRGCNPSVGTTVSNNVVSLRINCRADSREQADRAVADTLAACRERLGDLIYGADDETLPGAVAKLLVASRSTVTTAESCTGGLLAKYLTDVSGSSAYFAQGFVAYSNEAKRSRLGVSENVINVHGAVSEPVVLAMARNARRLADADFALAISGVAGPTGGTPVKPVGTVCVALAHLPPPPEGSRPARRQDREDEVSVVARTFNFPGDREMIRDRAAKMALAMLRFRLLGKPLPF